MGYSFATPENGRTLFGRTQLLQLIVCGVFVFPPFIHSSWGQASRSADFQAAKVSFDAGKWSEGAERFKAITDQDRTIARSSGEYPEAALFELRCRVNDGNIKAFDAIKDRCLEATKGTTFEAEALLEVGKHLAKNAKDTPAAVAQFNTLIAEFPNNTFAASGALYERGLLESDVMAMPLTSRDTLKNLAERYPASPFCDDALVVLARVEMNLGNLAGITDAARQLKEMGASPVLQQKVQFEMGEYHSRISQNKPEAISAYQGVLDGFPTQVRSQAAAQARVRIADLIPSGNFFASIDLYRQAENDPAAPVTLRAWASLNLAYMQYQVKDDEGAKKTLEALVGRKDFPKVYKEKAEQALKALRDPQSLENAQLRFDRGARCRKVRHSFDVAFFDYRSVVIKLQETADASSAKAEVQSLTTEEQAQWQYKLAFALYMTGYGKKSYEICNDILKEFQPTDITKWQCLYTIAFLDARAENFAAASGRMREIIDSCPVDEITRDAYMELVRCLHFQNDKLGAVLALEEFKVRFPHHFAADHTSSFQKHLIADDLSIDEALEQSRPGLIAKWSKRPPSILPPDPFYDPQIIAADAVQFVTGGAQ